MNRLVIVTPARQPEPASQSIDDLAAPGVQLVLAAEGVPVGDYAREALDTAGIRSRGRGQRRLERGRQRERRRQDHGGRSRRRHRLRVRRLRRPPATTSTAVKIPDDVNVIATYPIAVVEGAPNADLAAEFVAYVTGSDGQATLKEYGFEPVA